MDDAYGERLDFTQGARLENNRGVIATNGQQHDNVVAAVRKALEE